MSLLLRHQFLAVWLACQVSDVAFEERKVQRPFVLASCRSNHIHGFIGYVVVRGSKEFLCDWREKEPSEC